MKMSKGLSARFIHALLVLWTVLLSQAQGERVCNNAAALCGRKYNEIAQLGAHDSPFIRNPSNDYTIAGDQFYRSVAQLDAGVRMLTAQIHKFTTSTGATEWHLCHSYCALYDAGLFSAWLVRIRDWLDDHPNDVVTILLVNSDDATPQILGNIFEEAQIAHYAYKPADTTRPTTDWPTLNTMINSNKRLVAFFDSLPPSTNTVARYLLDQNTFIFSTNYNNTKTTSYTCAADSPPAYVGRTAAALASGRMPLMNHFLYDTLLGGEIETSAPEHADNTNAPGQGVGMLGLEATQCTKVYGRPPTYLLVDFANVGPAIDTVDRLNKVTGATSGRCHLPDTTSGSMKAPGAGLSCGGGGSTASVSSKRTSSSLSAKDPKGTGSSGGGSSGDGAGSSPQNGADGGIAAQRWNMIQVVAWSLLLPLGVTFSI